MAKAAKKPAKPAAKSASSKKPEKKAAPAKKEAAPKKAAAPKKEAKKPAPVVEDVETVEESAAKAEVEQVPVPKISKKERAAKVALDKLNAEEFKKWSDLKDKYGSEKAAAYSMSGTFEANKPILHKVLGWGYILNVQNDRLEVLFETGPKMLISNYKAR